jgi:PleD family two-component response regulator
VSPSKKPTKASTQAPAKAKASAVKPAPKPSSVKPVPAPPKAATTAKNPVTAKKTDKPAAAKTPAPKTHEAILGSLDILDIPARIVSSPSTSAAAKPAKPLKTTLDDLALDIDEKDELVEEEKKDLVKVLREDEDEPLETAFVPTDTSERYILVVDEEGQRRNETMTIVSQILPNAVVEVADDPEEALEIMQEADFDTYVVNFLMPGYSASPFVKAVANHPDHPLLIGFAADKISDALDQKKGLKIIPLKRLFDLEVNTDSKEKADKDE